MEPRLDVNVALVSTEPNVVPPGSEQPAPSSVKYKYFSERKKFKFVGEPLCKRSCVLNDYGLFCFL